eukprot:TRINITY_DN4169_c0_g1_i3.p1 TRINITY_DN4169_c0_g1~~TRINITY_DN4169_c0_g1_i3.p1  ORF type:complete len:727 (-),score=164.34 TRINITY_DN4169_c0_g1_i3:64-2244(-)
MIRRPPRSTLSSSSAASDVYKRQIKKQSQIKKVDDGSKQRLKNPYDKMSTPDKQNEMKQDYEDSDDISDNEDDDIQQQLKKKQEKKKQDRKLKKLKERERQKEMEEEAKEEEKKVVKEKETKQTKMSQQKREQEARRKKIEKDKKQQECRETFYIILFIIGFIICAGVLKYYEERYRKFEKYNLKSKFGKDLYEVLQVDSQASLQEIKKSYKKLVVIWHPDKNPNCGQKCTEKFQEITDAYEVLSNEEKRRSYDESSGAWAHIRSKAITLTSQNFERLVEDSNDVWIIEAYEDGDPHCERMADFWEELIQKLNNIGVQFGRINIETQKELVKRLPFHIVITPTIFSLAKGYDPEIYSHDYMHLLPTMEQFVKDSIHNEVKLVNFDEFKAWNQDLLEGKNQLDDVPELFMLNKNNQPSPYFKYNAIKYKNVIKFLSNSFGHYNKIQQYLNKSQNAILSYTDYVQNQRKAKLFNLNSIKQQNVKLLVQLAKYLTIPEIFKNNFQEFCHPSVRLRESSDDSSYDSTAQSICIVFPQPMEGPLLEKAQQFLNFHLDDLTERVKDKANQLFEQYSSFQLVEINFDFQWKFKKLINQAFQQEKTMKNYVAFALFPDNQKISFLENEKFFDDWIDELFDAKSTGDHYLSELLGDEDVAHFLLTDDYNIIIKFLKKFKNNLFDIKMLFGCLLLFFGLKYFSKLVTQNLLKYIGIQHVVISFLLIFYQCKSDLFG